MVGANPNMFCILYLYLCWHRQLCFQFGFQVKLQENKGRHRGVQRNLLSEQTPECWCICICLLTESIKTFIFCICISCFVALQYEVTLRGLCYGQSKPQDVVVFVFVIWAKVYFTFVFHALLFFNMKSHWEDCVMVRANSTLLSLLPSNKSQAVALAS